jgi:MarR family transcriptional regulator, transcriptional regulator for hemolysin
MKSISVLVHIYKKKHKRQMEVHLSIRCIEPYIVERAHLYMMLLPLIIRLLIMRKYDYQDSIGFIVKSTAKAFESAFDQQLRRKANITVAQSRVIGTLALVKDGMTQREIASTIGIEAPTIVPIIDKLEEQGTVIRRPDHNDRRNNMIFLTGKSEAKWELIIECALELEKASHQGLSEEELKITKRTLRKIAQNVAGLYLKSSDQIEDRGEKSNNTNQVRKLQLLDHGKQRRI